MTAVSETAVTKLECPRAMGPRAARPAPGGWVACRIEEFQVRDGGLRNGRHETSSARARIRRKGCGAVPRPGVGSIRPASSGRALGTRTLGTSYAEPRPVRYIGKGAEWRNGFL